MPNHEPEIQAARDARNSRVHNAIIDALKDIRADEALVLLGYTAGRILKVCVHPEGMKRAGDMIADGILAGAKS